MRPHSRRATRAAAVCTGLLLALVPASPGSAAPVPGALVLPAPPPPEDPALLAEVGALPDRLKRTLVPGPAVNDETVEVALGAGGAVSQVFLTQRIELTGTGDYVVRQRGPARKAVSLDDSPPPVTKLGTVVWSGFVPGSRSLAARLTLDALLEARRLPLAVDLQFTPDAGPTVPVPLGGALPGPGRVEVTVTNTSEGQVQVGTGTVPVEAAAPVLDDLLEAARTPGPRPPVAGAGLPPALPAEGSTGPVLLTTVVPLALTGSITATAADGTPAGELSGPATAPAPGGGTVAGVLATEVTFTLAVTGPATLDLDLTARPALDPRTLTPPAGAPDWASWAASGPSPDALGQATQTLVAAAAAAARASVFSPYLGADLPGEVSTAFVLTLDTPEVVSAAAAPLEPRPGAIALVLLAAAAVGGNAVALWRLA